jgi:hypothetical protein
MFRRSLLGYAVVAIALTTAAARGQSKPPVLDKSLAKRLAVLSEHWWKARPATRFVEWDPKQRSELETEARALGAIPEGTLGEVVDLLWAPAKKLGPKGELVKGKLTISTPYGPAWCYLATDGKKPSLLVGLHGGGADAGSADESRSTWEKPGCVGMYPQGIKLVDDTWNTVHGERFVLSLIEIAKAQYDVDPDHVYVAGFSMGGTGSWFFAGRHTDILAGAGPYSGVLMAAPRSQLASQAEVQAIQHGLVPNVRNLAMWYTIGLADRNCMPGTYLYVADMLSGLRQMDPEGYAKIHFQTYPDLPHAFPPGEPQAGLKFLFAESRDTFPTTIVWEYASDPMPQPSSDDPVRRIAKPMFYWLGCKEPVDRQKIRATRSKNEFTLDCDGCANKEKGLTIFLNARMINPAAEVVVRSGDKEVYRGKPAPDVWTVLQTLDDKLDRSMVFDRRIEL